MLFGGARLRAGTDHGALLKSEDTEFPSGDHGGQ